MFACTYASGNAVQISIMLNTEKFADTGAERLSNTQDDALAIGSSGSCTVVVNSRNDSIHGEGNTSLAAIQGVSSTTYRKATIATAIEARRLISPHKPAATARSGTPDALDTGSRPQFARPRFVSVRMPTAACGPRRSQVYRSSIKPPPLVRRARKPLAVGLGRCRLSLLDCGLHYPAINR